MRSDAISLLSHGKVSHCRFILVADIGQRQRAIDRQTLLSGMPTEQLELGADQAMFGEIGQQLVPKQMRIDTLGNPCRLRVLFDNLA